MAHKIEAEDQLLIIVPGDSGVNLVVLYPSESNNLCLERVSKPYLYPVFPGRLDQCHVC